MKVDYQKIIQDAPTDVLAEGIVQYNDELPILDKRKTQLFLLSIKEFKTRIDKADHYTKLLGGLQQWGIRHPEILHLYISLFLGYDIPRKSFCRKAGHVAPFTLISDMYFERVRNAIAFANRTGGKTLNTAILNHLDMMFKGGCEIVSAGAIKDQASKAYKYFVEFHQRNEILNDQLSKEPTLSYSEYRNMSMLQVITGSIAGMNGPHPQKARLDEVELMDWDVLQQGFSMPVSKVSHTTGMPIDAQLLMSSTRKYESGTMQRLLDLAKKDTRDRGGFKVYQWCLWEILQKCNRKCKKDPYYGNCPVYEICEGRAHLCEGFYTIDDFIDKATLLDRDTFDAEWLNKRPSRQIFVYGDYWNEKIHVIKPKELIGDIEYVAGIDFGSSPGHDFVYKVYAADCTAFKREVEELEFEDETIRAKITFYLVYEYRSGKNTTEEHAIKIKESPRWKPDLPIFADPSAKQQRIDLEDLYGIATMEAINAVETGIYNVRGHLQIIGGQAHYYIFEDYLDCSDTDLVGTAGEFDLYKFRRFRDGKINRKEPEPINDHGMDVDRYVISSSIPYFREKFQPVFETVDEEGYWFSG